MLESGRIFEDGEFDVCATIPQDFTARVSAIVSKTGNNDDAFSHEPQRYVLCQLHFRPKMQENLIHCFGFAFPMFTILLKASRLDLFLLIFTFYTLSIRMQAQ